jgi:uncharacterized protein YhbP (UPF0306 family)
MDVEQTIREYLPGILHMSLGTCVENMPWVCEVHFVYDDDLNIYWRSKPSRRHSQEIARNPNVAANIVQQHGKGDKPRGLYVEGTAQQVNIEPNSAVHSLFHDRLGDFAADLSDLDEDDGRKFYKLTVSKWYLFDARESYPPQKYELKR